MQLVVENTHDRIVGANGYNADLVIRIAPEESITKHAYVDLVINVE